MQGTNRKTLVLFWFLLLALIGIRIRADASILPPLLLAVMLLTGGIDIPIAHKRMRKPVYIWESVHLLEKIFSVSLEDFFDKKRFFDTAITVNLGGFVIPLASACCLGVAYPDLAMLEICIVIIAVTHIMATFYSGFGIKIPDYIGVVPLLFALLLAPDDAAMVMFVAGVAGVLIGLCTVLGTIDAEREGCARISLGGAGSFHAVYIMVLLAMLLDVML
ncbi:MAG: hypothetical protein C5S47_02715 [Candidatus Methanogasteraceae archaeon]|nr:MAG: hypothetical protein C5S47_02715 [ANME-2 cluster archaeon]